MTVKREIDLSDEDIAFIDSKVASGEGDANAVVGAAIKMLRDEEAYIDRWVREEVIPTYERWKAGGEKTYTADEVFERVQKRIKNRAAQKAS